MTNEATRKRIEEMAHKYANEQAKLGELEKFHFMNIAYKEGASEWGDIRYNQAIEDALKEIQWSNITYEVKGNLMEKLRLFKLKSSTLTQDENP